MVTVETEAAAAHRALESMWGRVVAGVDGARFERRSDLIVAACPEMPLPQLNGAWITNDSVAAVKALPEALAEVEASGGQPCAQTRSGQHRSQAAARALGLTHSERIPAMVVLPGELHDADANVTIAPIRDEEVDATIELLALTFELAKEPLSRVCFALRATSEATWYVGRVDGHIVSTALGFTTGGVTGIFNVATLPHRRRCGYGAALTARAVRDGFEAGAGLAFLQSSEIGRTVYRGLGFREVEEYVLLTRPPDA